jgi:nucleoside-diphosphate-sugar epimerase
MPPPSKKALIIGGCGRRGKLSAQRLLNEDYLVVLVDNLSCCSEHPEKWEFWGNENIVFYEEDAIKFMTEPNFFYNFQWDMVCNFAKIKDEDTIEEKCINTLLDATFFYWLHHLSYKPAGIVSPPHTEFARDIARHMDM